MRTYITLLITLLSLTSYGQKFSIGVNGGLLFNSAPLGDWSTSDGKSNPLFSAKAAVDMRKIQVGAGCLFSRYEYEVRYWGGIYTDKHEFGFINPYAFINLKKTFVRSYFYYGANLGLALFSEEDKPAIVYPGSGRAVFGKAITAGLQAGYRFNIYKGLGISAEAGARYISSSPEFTLYDVNAWPLGTYGGGAFLSFPITLGVDYQF